jgi:DNA-binding MarR family transcriptional regulator
LTKAQRAAWGASFEAHARALQRIDDDLAAAGVGSLHDYDVLYMLYRAPDRRLRLSELSDAVVISRSGLTRLLDRLERRGLLHRKPCAEDRRGAYAVLTDDGLEEMRRIWAIYGRGIAEYFAAHLSAEETETIQRAFGRIADALRPGKRTRAAAEKS